MNTNKGENRAAAQKPRYFIGKREYTLAQVKALAKQNEGCAALVKAADGKAAKDGQ